MRSLGIFFLLLFTVPCHGQWGDHQNPYNPDSVSNPYGAGSPYRSDGLRNPYSRSGSRYSNESWSNPYATRAPEVYDEDGTYYGQLSTNRYGQDSTSNPYSRYGSPYSPRSLQNPYGTGSPYYGRPLYVYPRR